MCRKRAERIRLQPHFNLLLAFIAIVLLGVGLEIRISHAQSSSEPKIKETSAGLPSSTQETKPQLFRYTGSAIPINGYVIATAQKPEDPNFHSCDNEQITVDLKKTEKAEGDCNFGSPSEGIWLALITGKSPEGFVSVAYDKGNQATIASDSWKKLISNSKNNKNALMLEQLKAGDWIAFYHAADSNVDKIVLLRSNKM